MIASLSGVIGEKTGDGRVVLEVGGVGYGLWLPFEDFTGLSVGHETKLYVHENIKEEHYDLYGFMTTEGRALFELLLSVNGVGPKMALSVLNLGPADSVKLAIAEGNVKYIQAASGVGKRLAERVVVDLKDKVGLTASDDATTFLQASGGEQDEATQALIALGYSPQDAGLALKDIDIDLPTEARVKAALKKS